MQDATNKNDLDRYPLSADDIVVTNYHNLVLKVFQQMVGKYGQWLYRHRDDIVQTGYIGLLKAKEKYVPGRGSFLGLAYLRIMSAMQGEIARYAKYETHTVPLEKIKAKERKQDNSLTWEDRLSGTYIDYGLMIRSITDEDSRKLLLGIIEMYPYWKLRSILNESKEEHDARVEQLKGEMVDLLEIYHPQ